jgi:hypothetical protein
VSGYYSARLTSVLRSSPRITLVPCAVSRIK